MSDLPPPTTPAAPSTPPPNPYGVPAYGFPGYGTPTNTLAIVSLVLSAAGLFTFVTAIAGVICGHIALGQIKRTGEQGRGLALGGVIGGYCVIGLYVLIGIFTVVITLWTLSLVMDLSQRA